MPKKAWFCMFNDDGVMTTTAEARVEQKANKTKEFLGMPDELLIEIVGFVVDQDAMSFVALRLTCKELNVICSDKKLWTRLASKLVVEPILAAVPKAFLEATKTDDGPGFEAYLQAKLEALPQSLTVRMYPLITRGHLLEDLVARTDSAVHNVKMQIACAEFRESTEIQEQSVRCLRTALRKHSRKIKKQGHRNGQAWSTTVQQHETLAIDDVATTCFGNHAF
eukprot:TRINITY_DN114_c0_g1_i11.p2 TRINITY_DN114_c0_g1~~TRINITY_DN114_c0_g1_i11.p2  ORF type:complete len:223 (-),score=9.08 TRINITY_DN114_c0_g1_i11:470-1138(-)